MQSDHQHHFADRLRASTRSAHRALDHHPILAPLIRTPLTKEDYIRALAALHGPQKAIEHTLRNFVPATDFPARLGDLESDLETLGAPPFPLLTAVPRFDTTAQLIGAMYVLEGANLGGTAIARVLEHSLPPELPRSFFAHAGGTVRWEKFWSFAASQLFGEECFTSMASAASQTFDLYRTHLDASRIKFGHKPV